MEIAMNQQNLKTTKQLGLLGTIFGSLLIGLPVIPLAASAAPSSALNPCPGIFYEEPHNNRVLVPQGCPPNAATLRLTQQGQVSGEQTVPVAPNVTGVTPIQPPLPETRQNPIAIITPTTGTVDVRLRNNTNARVSYQAIGHTEPRLLAGREEIVLQGLPTPVTITMIREDGGLLQVQPTSTSEEGILTVLLDETTNINNSRSALRIQKDGQVFLN
jgi:hypothetical protein